MSNVFIIFTTEQTLNHHLSSMYLKSLLVLILFIITGISISGHRMAFYKSNKDDGYRALDFIPYNYFKKKALEYSIP